MEALKANAVAIKSRGWHHVLRPKTEEYDIESSYEFSQQYSKNIDLDEFPSQVAAMEAMFLSVSPIGIDAYIADTRR